MTAARLIVVLLGLWLMPRELSAAVPIYGYQIAHSYPHDTHAFTEGLFYLNGDLYESTGLNGQSELRRERLTTGEVLQRIELPARYFGEGIVNWGARLIQLTWRAQTGFVYDRSSLRLQRQFTYSGEGWGLTQNGRWIIMSDGTPELRFLDPQTLAEAGRLEVTYEGQPLRNLNELEWVRGEIYANIWQTDWIARIDPDSGAVVGLIDLRGLLPLAERVPGQTDVLNGIAYDAQGDRLFVTGKNWPRLFQIRLQRKAEAEPLAP
ncbi:MAG TPA: glutaminyl-peptide cyclotransferase [Steroidobacteraceae bacterium]|jgi:glutaminyl-peptide cyclotransferase|nr:glutaminyl-peptide cyclotransferase [Steroidobacteraceae bacterium]